MSKAAELAALIGSQSSLSNRNLIINGNFDVWQRGTSGFTGSEYIADRWKQNLSGATATSSQQSFTIGQTSVPNNPEYYVNMNCTTGNNNAGLHQRIENPKRLSNTTITISFWAKGTNPGGGSFDLDVYTYDGSGLHFPTNRQQPFTVTSGWQKFVKSVTLSDLSGETFTSSGYTLIGFTQPNGDTGTAAWSLDLAQVQVELGEQATPFEHRSFGDELRRCQRYYAQLNGANGSTGGIGTAYGIDDTSAHVDTFPPVIPMRATATASLSDASTFTINTAAIAAAASARTILSISDRHMRIDFTHSSDSNTTNGSRLVRFNSTSAFIAWDAEL
jgi:hypothetical protein